MNFASKNNMPTPVNLMSQTGISFEDLDSDHQRLFSILERLREFSQVDCDPIIVGETLADLNDYTTFHFRREAAVMKANDYPGYEIHIQAHRKLEDKLEQFLSNQSLSVDTNLRTDLVEFLEVWFVDHIMSMDNDFTNWAGKNETFLQ